MSRFNVGRSVAGLASVGFVVTAGLHGSGFGPVTELASTAPAELRPLVPPLWLAFSFDLVVVGLIVGVIAYRPPPSARLLLVIASLCPIGAAGLQLRFLGFIPPTALLFVLAGLTWAAAVLLSPERERSKFPQ